MSIETMTAFLGLTYLATKKESPIEPFKRTLELADAEHKKAVSELLDATNELVRVSNKKKEPKDGER